MKHLKTFEENYITNMQDMVDPEPGFTPPFEPGSEDEVIKDMFLNILNFQNFLEIFWIYFQIKKFLKIVYGIILMMKKLVC